MNSETLFVPKMYRLAIAVVGLLSMGTHAFSPITWAKFPGKELALMPINFAGHNLRSLALPLKLTIGVPNGGKVIPHITPKSDNTISVGGWCVEAAGQNTGSAVFVNKCNGGPDQQWTWIPDGRGRNMIQLKNSNKCLDVIDNEGDLSGARIELQDCKDKASESWRYEYEAAMAAPVESAFNERYVYLILMTMTGIGALSLGAWMWQQPAKTPAVADGVPLCADPQCGLSLAARSASFAGKNGNGSLASRSSCRETIRMSMGDVTHGDLEVDGATLTNDDNLSVSRRKAIVAAMAGLSAEAAWRQAVATAAMALDASPSGSILPPGTIQQIESGRAVVIRNWLPPEETAALIADGAACFEAGAFKKFAFTRNPNPTRMDKVANDRWVMPSGKTKFDDGPFVDPAVGNFEVRQRLKARMAEVKAVLARELQDRPTLVANDIANTHELEYLRYGAGALLGRHTDEHHLELRRPGGARLPLKPNASRRSITWMVYLNDGWEAQDGGQLRLHERAQPSVDAVGARGPNLQVGWLRATATEGERPVFLDALRPGPENESCMLYTSDADGRRRDLRSVPFANIALAVAGGDAVARNLMVDLPADAARFHLLDAHKSMISVWFPAVGDAGEDGGERVRDVVPHAGTLVMFDSVSVPHEVLQTNRERFAIQGWFHEKLYSAV